MPSQFGITPKRATVHWDDLVSEWQLHISWQLTTPFGTFPEKQERLTFGDLAALLNTIKTIWAIFATGTDATEVYVFAPLGDFSILNSVPEGFSLRTVAEASTPVTDALDPGTPDTVPDYDGEGDDWGATPPA